MRRSGSLDVRGGVLANLLVLCVGLCAWVILAFDEDLYYRSVQEDEYLEWASFWAFFAAGIAYLGRALRPTFEFAGDWLLLVLGAFCLLVSFEEISWGQRILGYRPPEYFLEANFQQELNVHNLVDTDLRKLALRVVIFGYGVALPVMMLVPFAGDPLRRLGVIAPPAGLLPAFLGTGLLQLAYPMKFTGEWVEFMLGLCFLFAALTLSRRNGQSSESRRIIVLAVAWIAVVAAGMTSAAATRLQRDADPGNLEAAGMELEALRRDFAARRVRSGCGVHKRLYTFAIEYGQRDLLGGEFARLTEQGLADQRATYLLDPWNYAYWLRDNCAEGELQRTAYLYSFGPNRRRDSTKWEIRGDDVVAYLRGAPR